MKTRKLTTAGLLFFGITILFSSCKVLQPGYVGPLASIEEENNSAEIIDPADDQILETPLYDLTMNFENSD